MITIWLSQYGKKTFLGGKGWSAKPTRTLPANSTPLMSKVIFVGTRARFDFCVSLLIADRLAHFMHWGAGQSQPGKLTDRTSLPYEESPHLLALLGVRVRGKLRKNLSTRLLTLKNIIVDQSAKYWKTKCRHQASFLF